MLPYSPLCDTDLRAYLAFLYSHCSRDGKLSELGGEVGGSGGIGKDSGGSNGVGDSAARVFLGICGAVEGPEGGLALDVAADYVRGGVCGLVGCGRTGGSGADVRMAGDDVVDSRCRLVGGNRFGYVGQVDGSGDCGRGETSQAGWQSVDSSQVGVPKWTRKKEKKMHRERCRKERRRCEKLTSVCQDGSVVDSDSGSREKSVGVDEVDSGEVPEWRRKGKKKSLEVRRREERLRLSKFAGCDEAVRKELLESQAKRYIAENNTAVVKAEEQARRVSAGLKAGVPERNVEVQRLQLDKRMNKFAEEYMKDDDGVSRVKTVLSEGLEDIIAVPVMSEGSSVSPDSSISVAQVNKMIKLIHGQASENEELRKAMGKLGIDDSGIASATSVEPVLTGYGFFPAEDDLAHQLEFYSDY